MNLIDRLKLLVQSTVHGAVDDLFGEGDAPQARSTERAMPIAGPDTAKLLKQADARLARMHEDLAQALAREKRAEVAWQTAKSKAQTLSDEVDTLLKANQTDAAREALAKSKAADADVATLEKSLQQYHDLTTRLKQEMDALEGQLKQVRERLHQAGEREAHADLATQHQQAQQTQSDVAKHATTELDAREEQVAQREDQIAAKDDIVDTKRMEDIIRRLQK